MSIKSRSKEVKKPSPNSSKRARQHGKTVLTLKPINITALQHEMHIQSILAGDGDVKTGGEFGADVKPANPPKVKKQKAETLDIVQ